MKNSSVVFTLVTTPSIGTSRSGHSLGRRRLPPVENKEVGKRMADKKTRDRDKAGRPKNARPRDALGRPLPKGALGSLVEEPPSASPEEALERGMEHFNAGRYFQAHEA